MFDPLFWRDRRVVVTGHTGFKGAWLTLWLNLMGARVTALALPAESPLCLYSLVRPDLEAEVFGDLRDPKPIADVLADAQPEIVLHLAAQALVRCSYAAPCDTFATNVLGTAHLLDAVRHTPTIRAVVVVTTDKVYENLEIARPFVETDRLGGHDPYSASKACTEILTVSFRRSFFEPAGRPAVATARAGNVIGGGDWSAFRVVRDLVEAFETEKPVSLRFPQAVRPWQHVLDPLAGYLMLAQAMVTDPAGAPSAFNFGPDAQSFRSVSELVQAFTNRWGGRPGWQLDTGEHPHEAQFLTLDARRARALLDWRPLLSFDEAVSWTADWYLALWNSEDIGAVTRQQIDLFSKRLRRPASDQMPLPETA
jgi:CDP-glucose 4,6-dehydratase